MPLRGADYGSLLLGCFVCVCVLVNYCASAAPQGYYYNYPNQQRRASNGYTYSQPARQQYTNSYRQQQQQQQRQSYYYPRQNAITPPTTTTTTARPYRYRASKADTENAKFAGVENLQSAENDESGKSLKKILKKKLLRRFINPCSPFGRDAGANNEQGRFLFDVNVYNVYPGANVGGLGGRPCGGYGYGFGSRPSLLGLGGGGLGGGLLSDPVAAAPAYGGSALSTFLGLWAPGILQSSLQQPSFADAIQRPQQDYYRPLPRPQPLSDPQQPQSDPPPQQAQADETADLQSDPAVDPAYGQGPLPPPVRRPNRVYYDSQGAPPLTPAQLVGGVASQVNGFIQQLTGNVQPVYGGTYRRTRTYG